MRYIIERRGNDLYILEVQEDGTFKLIGRGSGQDDALIEMARLANRDRKAELVEGLTDRHGPDPHVFELHLTDGYCVSCHEREDSPVHVTKLPRHHYQISGIGTGKCAQCGELESSAYHKI